MDGIIGKKKGRPHFGFGWKDTLVVAKGWTLKMPLACETLEIWKWNHEIERT